MGIENHDRLDQMLTSEEYIEMTCGSPGYVLDKKTNSLVIDADGDKKTEKKYCDPNCPTLVAAHKAG